MLNSAGRTDVIPDSDAGHIEFDWLALETPNDTSRSVYGPLHDAPR